MITKIRVMESSDIPFAIKLTNTEGWGFTGQDFLRLLKLDARGCFIAVNGKRKIGLTTATTYDRVGWIGNVIVAPAARGQGAGTQLLDSAISYIERRGIRRIGLYSYPQTRSLYRKLGFAETTTFVRYFGKPTTGDTEETTPFRRQYLNELAKFDKDRFGADRKKLLKFLYNEFPELCFVSWDHGKISGYVIAKGAQSGYEIGPCVCDQSAEALLNAELNQIKRRKVEITVPKRNRNVSHLLSKLGFSKVGEVHEMYRGGIPKRRLETIYAAGALEKG